MSSENKFIIAIYVDNQYGVLSRVTAMFTRRGFNIESLTVGETEDPKYSRITVTMSGARTDKNQLVSQLTKLYNVKKVVVINSEEGIKRELLLLKIRNDQDKRPEILETVDIFRAKVIDYSDGAMCLECTGDSQKCDAFIENFKKYGIIEMCRTGIVALDRGADNIWSH
ncbi:MAG: acetolactate synthase small subunit [Clostridiales bacterium]|nr:acetolactate synthase small subunit [Clostridiales bacterium]